MSPLIGLLVIVPLAFALNWLIYQIVLMPLVRRAKNRDMLEVDSILATFGLLFVVQGIMLVMFGGQYHTYSYLSIPVNVLGITVSLNRLIALALRGGHRACALSRADAHAHRHRDPRGRGRSGVGAAVAIDVRAAAAFAFALGGALVAAGGVLIVDVPDLQRRDGRRLHHEGADRRHHGRRRQHGGRAGRGPDARRWRRPRSRAWSIRA